MEDIQELKDGQIVATGCKLPLNLKNHVVIYRATLTTCHKGPRGRASSDLASPTVMSSLQRGYRSPLQVELDLGQTQSS